MQLQEDGKQELMKDSVWWLQASRGWEETGAGRKREFNGTVRAAAEVVVGSCKETWDGMVVGGRRSARARAGEGEGLFVPCVCWAAGKHAPFAPLPRGIRLPWFSGITHCNLPRPATELP